MVITPNIPRLDCTRGRDGVKYFELTAEPVNREVLPGLFIRGWGYNGSIPGPCIQLCPGDTCSIRLYNRLPDKTSLDFLGMCLPYVSSGSDSARTASPGGYADYSFTVKNRPGTYIYRPGAGELAQLGMGMCGNIIVLPREESARRDYSLMLQSFNCPALRPGETPSGYFDIDPYAGSGNIFCVNGRCYPHTESMKACAGETCRIRFSGGTPGTYPMYLEGHRYCVCAYDGRPLPRAVPRLIIPTECGQTCDISFTASNPGSWLCGSSVPVQRSNNFSSRTGGMCIGLDYI